MGINNSKFDSFYGYDKTIPNIPQVDMDKFIKEVNGIYKDNDLRYLEELANTLNNLIEGYINIDSKGISMINYKYIEVCPEWDLHISADEKSKCNKKYKKKIFYWLKIPKGMGIW